MEAVAREVGKAVATRTLHRVLAPHRTYLTLPQAGDGLSILIVPGMCGETANNFQ
jgi:hypothetical protein